MSNQVSRFHDALTGPKFLNIDHNDIMRIIAESLPDPNLDRLYLTRPGAAKFFARYDLRDRAIYIPEADGPLTPTIFVRNANDGSGALGVGVGLFRSVCENGLYFGLAGFLHKIRHIDGPKAHGLLDALPTAVEHCITAITDGSLEDMIRDAIETPVADPISVIGSLPTLISVRDKAIEAVINATHRPEDNPYTAWGVYNLVNELRRRRGRSVAAAAESDIGMLEHVMTLAAA
jgi:hypothetical protein